MSLANSRLAGTDPNRRKLESLRRSEMTTRLLNESSKAAQPEVVWLRKQYSRCVSPPVGRLPRFMLS
jgi:hypothetical protein